MPGKNSFAESRRGRSASGEGSSDRDLQSSEVSGEPPRPDSGEYAADRASPGKSSHPFLTVIENYGFIWVYLFFQAALGVDKKEESPDLSACEINRALLFNSPEDSDSSFPLSELTSEESVCRESSEDDSSSVWSLQVHDGSSQKNDEEEEEDIDDEDDDLQESLSDDKDDSSFPISEPSLQESVCREATEDDSSSVWSLQVHDGSSQKNDEDDENDDLRELCEGIRRMSVGKSELPEFAGKHVRFKYDSDDEIVGKEEVTAVVSPSVIRLKGLPVPEGKHLRFQEEEED